MPHSSGGGSHSGGSHSSSSSSSYGSFGGGSSQRTSTSPFSGAYTFVKYDNNGAPDYVYSTDRELNQKPGPLRYLLLVIYLPFLFVVISAFKSSFNLPSRLPLTYDTTILIEDHMSKIEDEKRLSDKLEDFLNETGISVSVLTTSNQAWKENYNSLETYAYEQYVLRFPDESHWLIVYTTDNGEDFDDWYFEGMQGNDTDPILTSRITNIFNQSLQKYLLQNYSLDKALIKAISDIEAAGLMKFHVEPLNLIVTLAITGFLLVHMYMLVFHNPNRKYREYALIPQGSKILQCDYCGSSYYSGTVLECPNCGAPAKNDEN